MNKHTVKSTLVIALSASALALALPATTRAETGPSPDAQAARAEIQKMLGFQPSFFKALPDNALPGMWGEIKTLAANDATALPCKVKEIISIAVAAQLPSPALVYGHKQIARTAGASDAEIADGVAIASLTRHWSTFFNGVQLDEAKFRAEIAHLVDNMKKGMASGAAPPAPMPLTDAKSVSTELKQQFGFVPEFVTKFPAEALAGAWKMERDVEMSPSALSDKYKSLVGVAVAAQIPCRYCLVADTEFAKLSGATDREIAEAVAMAGLTRQEGTLLTGLGVDDATYRKDMERIAKVMSAGSKKQAKAATGKAATMTNVK
jgi:AhpD family alkylhydroperoxidase